MELVKNQNQSISQKSTWKKYKMKSFPNLLVIYLKVTSTMVLFPAYMASNDIMSDTIPLVQEFWTYAMGPLYFLTAFWLTILWNLLISIWSTEIAWKRPGDVWRFRSTKTIWHWSPVSWSKKTKKVFEQNSTYSRSVLVLVQSIFSFHIFTLGDRLKLFY